MIIIMKLYIFNKNNINKYSYEYLKKIMPIRYENAKSIDNIQKKIEYLSFGFILYKIFGNVEQYIYYNKYNKPFIKNNLYFNISHKKQYIVLAIDKNEIGVDIEYIDYKNYKYIDSLITISEKNIINNNFVSDDFFCQTIINCFKKFNDTNGVENNQNIVLKSKLFVFYLIWTIKESILKCIGTGFIKKPNEINIQYNFLNKKDIYENTIYSFDVLYYNNYLICISKCSNNNI